MPENTLPLQEVPRFLLTIDDAGRALRLSRAQLYREMSTNRLRYVSVGRARRIPTTALADFVTLLEQEAAMGVSA